MLQHRSTHNLITKMRSSILSLPINISLTLSESKSAFLAAHLLPSGKPYTSLIVAAAIFQPNATTHRILLLKRSPAERLFSHHWEIPGGKVDDTDKTIWDALKREVKEETGLSFKESAITYGERGFEWALGEDGKDDALGDMDKDESKMALELNFIVEDEELPTEVKLDPEEHLESLWAGEKEVAELKMTPEMREVVENAFAILKLRKRFAWASVISELDLMEKEGK